MNMAHVREGDDEGPTTITVSIEVVLQTKPKPDPAETPQSDDTPEDSKDHADADEAQLPQYILPLPFFRFRFIEGSAVETPTVLTGDGATNESWEELVTATAVEGSAVPLDGESNGGNAKQEEEGEEEEGPGGGGTGEETAEDQPLPPAPLKRWRWTRDFPIEAVDDRFLMRFNENPHFVCTLGNKEVEEGSEVPIRATAPANTGSLLGFLPMDVSPLLDGDTSVARKCCSLERGTGFAPHGIVEWSMNVSVPEPMLNRQQRKRFNPLSVHVQRVVRVPGIDIEETRNPRMLKAMLPTRFALLKEHCYSIFGLFQMKVKRSTESMEYMRSNAADTNEDGAAEGEEIQQFQRIITTLPIGQEIESELKGPTKEELKAMEKAKKKRARQNSKNSKGGKGGKKPSSEGADLPERDRRRRDLPFDHKTVVLSGLLDRIELLEYLNKGTTTT